MTDHFDPYHKWLGIPPAEQPPDLYRLLGTVRFEDDPDVIANAADQRMAHLRHFQAGKHGAESQRLLNEVAAARVVLLNAEKKASYDLELDLEQPAEEEAAIPPVVPPPLPPPVAGAAPLSLSIDDDPEEYPLPPAATLVSPPPPAVPPPPTPIPISYSTPPNDVEGSLESLPYHPDFEAVDAMDVDPGWDLAPPQAAYDLPAASVPPPSSIGMETRQWLDNVLAELSARGPAVSAPAARPWDPRGHVPVLPVVDESEPVPPPDAVPPDEDLAAPSWFGRWEGPSMAAVRAVWSIALTALLFLLGLSVLAATPIPLPEEREWLVIHPGEKELFDEVYDLDDDLLDWPIDLFEPHVPVADIANDQWSPRRLNFAGSNAPLLRRGWESQLPDNLLASATDHSDDLLSCRAGHRKDAYRVRYGGNAKSEAAVALALEWFAKHQLPDGSWSFDHTLAPSCRGQCGNPGRLREARNAATALALLAFLGAGHSQKAGDHQQVVRAGLMYLVGNMTRHPQGGSFHEAGGTMYSHALATTAMAEAYGMTHDHTLYKPAQQAVDYICHAQDPVGGGWRYTPRQMGDLSVTGWQIEALCVGQAAGFNVPPERLRKAAVFLNSVQANSGAGYGYTGAGTGEVTTAIGLSCRILTGWYKDHPALQRGTHQISDLGPSRWNMYFNYYATRLTFEMGDTAWNNWNAAMRDLLVAVQAKDGHEAGSWYFPGSDQGATTGGRHYGTAMATLVLEVYYRHRRRFQPRTSDEPWHY